jgi:hypothetical protein
VAEFAAAIKKAEEEATDPRRLLPKLIEDCQNEIHLVGSLRRVNPRYEFSKSIGPLWETAITVGHRLNCEVPTEPFAISTEAEARCKIGELRNWAVARQGEIEGTAPPGGGKQPPAADDVEWTKMNSPSEWAKVFGGTPKQFVDAVNAGTIRAIRHSSKSYQVAVHQLPAPYRRKHYPPATEPN